MKITQVSHESGEVGGVAEAARCENRTLRGEDGMNAGIAGSTRGSRSEFDVRSFAGLDRLTTEQGGLGPVAAPPTEHVTTGLTDRMTMAEFDSFTHIAKWENRYSSPLSRYGLHRTAEAPLPFRTLAEAKAWAKEHLGVTRWEKQPDGRYRPVE